MAGAAEAVAIADKHVKDAHVAHVAQPNDETLRNAFLSEACKFFLKEFDCMFHRHADLCVELLAVFSLPDETDDIKRVKDLMDQQLRGCISCIDSYHEAKLSFRNKYIDVYNRSVLEAFLVRLMDWDIGRQSECITRFTKDFVALASQKPTPAQLKAMRKKTLYVIYEILKYPSTLKNANLDKMFGSLFLTSQKGSSLRLNDSLLPGVIIFAVHSNTALRNWAHNTMKTIKDNQRIDLKQITDMESTFTDLAEHLRDPRAADKPYATYSFAADTNVLMMGFLKILQCMNNEALDQGFLLICPDMAEIISNHLASASDNAFWELLAVFNHLLRTSLVFLSKKGSEQVAMSIAMNIISHRQFHEVFRSASPVPNLQELVKTSSSTQNDLRDSAAFLLEWIRFYLERFSPQFVDEFSNMLLTHLLQDSAEWNSEFRHYLREDVLLHVVSSCSDGTVDGRDMLGENGTSVASQFKMTTKSKLIGDLMGTITASAGLTDVGQRRLIALVDDAVKHDIECLETWYRHLHSNNIRKRAAPTAAAPEGGAEPNSSPSKSVDGTAGSSSTTPTTSDAATAPGHNENEHAPPPDFPVCRYHEDIWRGLGGSNDESSFTTSPILLRLQSTILIRSARVRFFTTFRTSSKDSLSLEVLKNIQQYNQAVDAICGSLAGMFNKMVKHHARMISGIGGVTEAHGQDGMKTGEGGQGSEATEEIFSEELAICALHYGVSWHIPLRESSERFLFSWTRCNQSVTALLMLMTSAFDSVMSAFFDIVKDFKQACHWKAPVSVCAAPMTELVANMLTIVLAGDDDDSENEDENSGEGTGSKESMARVKLWFSTWSFLQSIFVSSVGWSRHQVATQSSDGASDGQVSIRTLVSQAYAVANYLLSHSAVLKQIQEHRDLLRATYGSAGTSFDLLSEFQNALVANFKWYSSLDEELRQAAVDVTLAMLKLALEVDCLTVDQAIIERVEEFGAGNAKSQLSEQQRVALLCWADDGAGLGDEDLDMEIQEADAAFAAAEASGMDVTSDSDVVEIKDDEDTKMSDDPDVIIVTGTGPASPSMASTIRKPTTVSKPKQLKLPMMMAGASSKTTGPTSLSAALGSSSASSSSASKNEAQAAAWLLMAKARMLSAKSSTGGAKKKSAPKKAGGKVSRLQQMRSEMVMEKKRMSGPVSVTSTSAAAKPAVAELKDLPPARPTTQSISLAEIAADISPEKPRRTIKVLDQPNVKPSSSLRRLPGSSSSVPAKTQPLGDITQLHKRILQWDYPPITENSDGMPPAFDLKTSLREIPQQFKSPQEYAAVFEPLLLLECWEQYVKSQNEVVDTERVVLRIEESIAVDGFYDIKFTARVEDIRGRGFSEFDMMHIREVIRTSTTDGTTTTTTTKPAPQAKSCLAKIQNIIYKKQTCTIVCRIFPGKRRSDVVANLRPQSTWEALKLFTLTTIHREYRAILNLPLLNLCSDILRPVIRKHRPDERFVMDVMRKVKANRPQAEAICAAVQQKSGFVLIQGPPGTGKTKTILALIGSILTTAASTGGGGVRISVPTVGGRRAIPSQNKEAENKNKNKKRVLCCAPSNAACDEIVRRLKLGVVDINQTNTSNPKKFFPKIVRLGSSDAIHADVKDVTLDLLVEEMFMDAPEYQQYLKDTQTYDTKGRQNRQIMASLTAEREQLRQQRSNDNSLSAEQVVDIEAKIREINEKRKEVLQQIEAERSKKNENSKALDAVKHMVRARILMNADVVCCTLSAAGHEIMSQIELEFPIVVIDEACQSIELSALIPLRYGCKKAIMVGDPNQLPPTVLSQLGKEFAYEQSLFQRIMTGNRDSVHLLSIQYRMHPSISVLPSTLFYESKLQDGPGLAEQCKAIWHSDPLLSPYKFFNVFQGKEQSYGVGASVFNMEEVYAVVDLVERICWAFPGVNFAHRIGVITPYKMQSKKIKSELRSRFGDKATNVIDVNTVDGFQGQEKDIIILSCVRGGADKGVGFLNDVRRMNVALTRAKCSLFVFGNAPSLKKSKMWRTFVDDAQKRHLLMDYKSGLFKESSSTRRGVPHNLYGHNMDESRRTASMAVAASSTKVNGTSASSSSSLAGSKRPGENGTATPGGPDPKRRRSGEGDNMGEKS